jgi:hypothetical protein
MSESLERVLLAAMDDARDRHRLGAEDARAPLPLKEPTGFVDLGCQADICVVIAVPVLLIGDYSVLIKLLVVAVVVVAGFLVVRPDKVIARRRRLGGDGLQIVRVHEGGVVWGLRHRDGKQDLRVYEWPKVTQMRLVRGEREHRAGVVGTTTVEYGFQLSQDGLPHLSINDLGAGRVPSLTAVGLAIRERYNAFLMGRARAALDRGETFSFGAAQVAPDGVVVDGRKTPWEQVRRLDSVIAPVPGQTSKSELAVIRTDGKPAGRVKHEDLSASEVFVALAEALIASRGRGG